MKMDHILKNALIENKLKVKNIIFCQAFTFYSSIACLLAGIILLILRLVHTPVSYFYFFIVVIVATITVATVRTLQQMPSDYELIKLLDANGACGGQLVAAFEVGHILPTQIKISEIDLKWSYKTSCQYLLTAIIFLCSAIYVPVPEKNTPKSLINLTREQQVIEETVEELEELGALTEEEAEEYIKQAEEVVENQTDDAAEIWEAMDNLTESLEQEAAEANQVAMWSYEKMEYMSLAAAEMERMMKEGQLTENSKAAKELQQMLEKFLKENPQEGTEQLQALAQQNEALSMQDLAQMIKELGLSKEQTEKLMKKLAQASQGASQKNQQQCQQPGQGSRQQMTKEDLLKFLESEQGKNPGSCSAMMLCMQSGGLPQPGGQPAIGQGPGTAPINFDNKVDESGAKFKPVKLPDGSISSLEDSELEGISIAEPEINTDRQRHRNQLNRVKSSGGNANKYRPLPRHKKAVENYFNN